MPTYEYECLACKKRFERFQKFAEPPVTECPECGGSVRKVLFPAGVVFKGSGWYINDSRKGGASDGGSDGGSTPGTKTEIKSDAKGESKTETKKAETKTKSESKAESASSAASGSTKSESSSPAKA